MFERIQAWPGGIELVHRLRQRLQGVWGYADILRLVPEKLRQALKPMVKGGHRPALIELDSARGMLGRIEATPAHPITRLAMRMLVLTAVRPGELRHAQ